MSDKTDFPDPQQPDPLGPNFYHQYDWFFTITAIVCMAWIGEVERVHVFVHLVLIANFIGALYFAIRGNQRAKNLIEKWKSENHPIPDTPHWTPQEVTKIRVFGSYAPAILTLAAMASAWRLG